MRSSRNQVRRFPSFFTELGMLGLVGHGEGQWLQSRGQKGSQKIKSKQIGRIFCYFPNPTLDSCLKNKPSDQQFDSSLPGNIVFLRTQDSMLESIAFVANLDTENSASHIHQPFTWVSRMELSGTDQPGCRPAAEFSEESESWPSAHEVLIV